MSDKTIFLSYRRTDSPSSAGRLYDALVREFGSHRTFMDVSNIPAGVDFVEYLDEVVAQSAVMLVLIGPRWAEAFYRTPDPSSDFIQLEIRSALERDIPVIPVLVEGANFPSAEQFPARLKPLATRQAIELDHSRWGRDVELLVKYLRPILNEPAEPTVKNIAFDMADAKISGEVGPKPKIFDFWSIVLAPLLVVFAGVESLLANVVNRSSRVDRSKPVPDHESKPVEPDEPSIPDIGDVFRRTRIEGADLTEIMTRLESSNLEILRDTRDIKALDEHLVHFDGGITKPKALAELETALWSTFLEENSSKAVLAYLARFPNGTYADAARDAREKFVESGDLDGQRIPTIFMNYRRIDSQDSADRVVEKLAEWIPKRNIMIDVDQHSITPGLAVKPQLEKLVRSCDIMFVLIHNRWESEFAERAARHLSGESPDFVRIEIEAALKRDERMPVVPLLLGETPKPDSAKLPEEVREVMHRSWHRISRESFDQDIASLIRQMSDYLERSSTGALKSFDR